MIEIPKGYEAFIVECERHRKDGTITKYTQTRLRMTEEYRKELKEKEKRAHQKAMERWRKQELWENSRWMVDTTMKKIQEAFSEFEDMVSSML